MLETSEVRHPVQAQNGRPNAALHRPFWKRWPGQFFRFGFVGVLNTLLDILLLNGMLWLFPTTDTFMVLLFNSIAYGLGAINSFLLNKYWTFGHRQQTTWGEVRRFAITTLVGITCNDVLIWFANNLFHALISRSSLWLNASKVVAIAGTVFVSYLGMRLWVFVKPPQEEIADMQSPLLVNAHIAEQLTQPLSLINEHVSEQLTQPLSQINTYVHEELIKSFVAPQRAATPARDIVDYTCVTE